MNIKNGLKRLNLVFWGLMGVLFGAGQIIHLLINHNPAALGPLFLVAIGIITLWWLCQLIISAFSGE